MNISNFNEDDSAAGKLVKWVLDKGIGGFCGLPSASTTAKNSLRDCGNDIECAIDSIINWRTAHAAGSGFVTGLGGIATLPVTLPASLVASYALGANTIASIAELRGYDTQSESVQTMILLALLGGSGSEILKSSGIAIGQQFTKKFIQQIPRKILANINKKVGFRLITKTGEKGAINLIKVVPLVGGVVGATVDASFVRTCGKTAKKVFKADY